MNTTPSSVITPSPRFSRVAFLLPAALGLVLATAVWTTRTSSAEASASIAAEPRLPQPSAVVVASSVASEASVDEARVRALPTLDGPVVAAPSFSWRSVFGAGWQIVSEEMEAPEVTDAREGTRGDCPAGMVHVQGKMKLGADIDSLQLSTCSTWMNHQYPERCAEYDRDAWRAQSAALPTKAMDYCVDRFEYPNLVGQYPVVYVSYKQATGLCEEQGKQLCDEDQWTFACEGEEARPYGYGDGYTRDASACVADKPHRSFDPETMAVSGSRAAALSLDYNWQGKASGSQPGCVSSFGVYDMNGNVDEWTTSSRGDGRRSILKGGYWGRVRARCRPSTRSHWEHHAYYQQGFRCCAKTPSAPSH